VPIDPVEAAIHSKIQETVMLEDLQATAQALGVRVSSPYRVGLGWELHRLRMHLRLRDWRGVRRSLPRLVRRLRFRADWAVWQCEGDPQLSARPRRGLTARVAERRMLAAEISEVVRLRAAGRIERGERGEHAAAGDQP